MICRIVFPRMKTLVFGQNWARREWGLASSVAVVVGLVFTIIAGFGWWLLSH